MNGWFLCRSQPGEPAVTLYCFPHSGGTAGEYVRWAGLLRGVAVCGLQLPGRGRRLDEPPVTRLRELIDALVGLDAFAAPFALFGHSLGALVAFELARALRLAGRRPPEHLLVSACPSPHLLPGRRPIHALPDRDLRADLEARHGPLPPEVAADPELLQLAMDHHRADSELLDTYAFEPGEPLAIPVTVIGGAADSVPEAALAAWAGHCTGPFQVRLLPGGHFYFRDRPRDLLQVVAGALSASGAAP